MCTQQMRHTAQISSMDGSVKKIMDLKEMMSKIRNHDEIYAVMSMCTHMPFVYCEPETYDDVVFIYFEKSEADEGAKWLLENKNPIQLAKIDKKSRLSFFTSLYPMGVNGISVNKGLEKETILQLNDLIRRQDTKQISVENPEFHLTALYFAQELRKQPSQGVKLSDELKELDEEMAAHFCEGKYIVAIEEGKGIPILQKNGKSYQPLFTDIVEFQKFNRGKRFRAAVIEYAKIPEILIKGTDGVAVNPFGANILLKV